MRREFTLNARLPIATQLRSWILTQCDLWSARAGGRQVLPGEELTPEQAFLQFRNFKDIFDQTLDNTQGYRSISQHTIAIDYFDLMLPGVDHEVQDRKKTTSVNPEHVIGCSWRKHAIPKEPEKLMELLNAPERGNQERATYLQIGELPYYLSHEGQNRVELFRRHKRAISAEIRLLCIKSRPELVRSLQGEHWLARWALDTGAIVYATVPFPSIALPMYRLLGAPCSFRRVPVDEKDIIRSQRRTINQLIDAVAIP